MTDETKGYKSFWCDNCNKQIDIKEYRKNQGLCNECIQNIN